MNARGRGCCRARPGGEALRRNPGRITLAWLLAKPAVTAPIASATSEKQLKSFTAAAELVLSENDRAVLDQASALDAT